MRRPIAFVRGIPAEQYIHGAMLVVLAVAFVTSFESGSEGARELGYPEGFEAALPLVCDVVAGVATVIHARVRADAAMRRLAAQFVLGPMLLSWGANAVDHVKAAPADVTWPEWGQVAWIVAVVLAAGICPVAVAALLHLSTKYAEYQRRQVGEKTEPASKKRWDVADIETRPNGEVVEHVVEDARTNDDPEPAPEQKRDEPEQKRDEPEPSKVRQIGTPKPWSARAKQLMEQGVPRSSAYRQAQREHNRDCA